MRSTSPDHLTTRRKKKSHRYRQYNHRKVLSKGFTNGLKAGEDGGEIMGIVRLFQ